jgi:ABC-type branched-subunit amino acid transport system ATPase component
VAESAALLEVRNVQKHFGGVQAVRDCSFSVAEHSITGLIGPNGAGKTTMLDLISGFRHPDAGSILFSGRPIQDLPAHRVSRLGLMRTFQTPREWAGLTVMENMLLAAPSNGRDSVWRALLDRPALQRAEADDRVKARDLLRQFGLFDLRDELAGNLSAGQKRLLEFARIALAQPRLVLLDEPQAGVNPILIARMAEGIRSLHASGITVLMVEHNLPFVERLCTTVLVMALGETIASGSMKELRANERVIDAYLGQAPAYA